jgi:hypothetical protein
METIGTKKNRNNKIYLIGLVLFIGAILLFYFQQQSIKKEEAIYKKSLSDLQAELKLMTSEMHQLKRDNKSLDHKKDSLQNNLNFLWKYKTLVNTANLRDQIGADLPFTAGERVRMKSDSSIVVVTDLIVGGNTYNYFIKYVVKNKKGLDVDVSPYEIESLK